MEAKHTKKIKLDSISAKNRTAGTKGRWGIGDQLSLQVLADIEKQKQINQMIFYFCSLLLPFHILRPSSISDKYALDKL